MSVQSSLGTTKDLGTNNNATVIQSTNHGSKLAQLSNPNVGNTASLIKSIKVAGASGKRIAGRNVQRMPRQQSDEPHPECSFAKRLDNIVIPDFTQMSGQEGGKVDREPIDQQVMNDDGFNLSVDLHADENECNFENKNDCSSSGDSSKEGSLSSGEEDMNEEGPTDGAVESGEVTEDEDDEVTFRREIPLKKSVARRLEMGENSTQDEGIKGNIQMSVQELDELRNNPGVQYLLQEMLMGRIKGGMESG